MTVFFEHVLNRSASACFVILTVLAARVLLRRLPKGYSYALWFVVLLRLLCPVSFQSMFSLSVFMDTAVQRGFGTATADIGSPKQGLDMDGMTAWLAKGQDAGKTAEDGAARGEGIETEYILVFIWSAGMAALAVYSLLRLCLLLCRLRTAKAAGNLSWYIDKELPASMKEVEVWRVKNLETAFVLGIFRPRVYVPEELSSETEQYILVHEMIHVRRRDGLWCFLGFLALCIHWFNPLVWAAWVAGRRDMEMSCDEAVVRYLGPDAKKGYSMALLAFAAGKSVLPGGPLAFGKGDAGRRIRNVLNYRKSAFRVTAAAAAVSIAVLSIFLAADPPERDHSAAAQPDRPDLDHDGTAERIRFDQEALEREGMADFTVEAADGTVLFSDSLSVSHAGWRTYALYHDESGDYLLRYDPYFGQGAGAYSYQLFSLSPAGDNIREEGSVSFSAGMPYNSPDNDVEEMLRFTETVNDLWERAGLLVTTDENVLSGLYDTEGRAVAEDGNYYAAPDMMDEPLHYVEQMSWTGIVLEGRESRDVSDLRERLEAVNEVLAEHRAEVADGLQ